MTIDQRLPGTGTPTRAHGDGILSRLSAAVYRTMILAAFLLVMSVPTLAVWTLLTPIAANAALFVAALLPVAPALGAALYALRAWSDDADLQPSRALWRGYARNVRDILTWWVGVLAIAAVLVTDLAYADAVPAAGTLRPAALILLVLLALVAGHLLVITSLFSFRTRDAVRIAGQQLFAQWQTSVAFLAQLIVAAGLVLLTSELVLAACAWAFAIMMRLGSRRLVADIERRFLR